MDFLAAARSRLQRLAAAHADGHLDAGRYDAERRGIEREIGDFMLSAAAANARVRPSRLLVASLGVLILAVAAAGYLATGSPMLARTGPMAAGPAAGTGPDAAASGGDAAGLQQIAAMVEKLAARMKERPDDAEGWTMLARSYTVLGRFQDALPAYAKAAALQPKNANLLADYADAVAATRGGVDNPETAALLARALAAEPDHPKALALAGTAAYDRGDYATAIGLWQKIVARLPADSELARQVQGSIDEARGRQASGGGASPSAARPPASGVTAAPGAVGKSVSGIVSLDPALAAQASPTDTVFIFARPPGGRMPLAVMRARVSDLPLPFRLDDSMAMAPGANLSSAERVTVGARISRSGNAIAESGDLSGEVTPVTPGASGVAIRIDQKVGAR